MQKETVELANLLPYKVRERLQNYLDYATDRFIDIASEENLSDEQIEANLLRFEIIFTLRLLYGYFTRSFRNYTSTLDYLESKQVKGFTIGSNTFDKGSPLYAAWRDLVNELNTVIAETDTQNYVSSQNSDDNTIRLLVSEIKAGLGDDRSI